MKASRLVLLFLVGLLALWAELPSATGLSAVGECPRPQGVGACVELCKSDASCGRGEKCCSNGCGHVCTKVTKARPSRAVGICPQPHGVGICVELCKSDASCGRGEKCCSNGCGHVCTKVVKGSR